MDEVIWATTSLAGATSWIHLDANGLGTHINNITGTKYWVVLNGKQGISSENHPGDMSSMEAFPTNWNPDEAIQDGFQYEAVVLTPGTLLYVCFQI